MVKDPQGGVVPGATVVLISEKRGIKSAPVVTNETGNFVFPNVVADTYTIEVTMSGFKTVRRAGRRRQPGDRLAIGALTIEVGGMAEVDRRQGRVAADSGRQRRAVVHDRIDPRSTTCRFRAAPSRRSPRSRRALTA